MAKTASFTLELELSLSSQERAFLRKRLRICTQIYNTCLREALKRLHKIQADKTYLGLLAQPKSRDRTQKLKALEQSHGYSDYQLQSWSTQCYRHFHGKIGSAEVQKLATRAFRAVEQLHYHKAKQVRFKDDNSLISVENKSNRQSLRWCNQKVLWGELALDVRIRKNDRYAIEALRCRTKYIRIVPRIIRGKERFFVQFIQEGLPPQKTNRQPGSPEAAVGVYTDASTVAVVSSTHTELTELSPNTAKEEKRLLQTLAALERSKFVTNPHNYNAKGKIKKGRRTWSYSNRYCKLSAKRRELQRKIRVKRKKSQEELTNRILALGLDIRTTELQSGIPNTFPFNQSPSTFLIILDRKLHYFGTELKKINSLCVSLEPDQNPNWIQIGDHFIQTNLYQAFLLSNTTDKLDLEQSYEVFRVHHEIAIHSIRKQGSDTLKQHIA